MARSGSEARLDEDSAPESYPMVDLENGQASKIDSNNRQSGSDRHHPGAMHVPDESGESDNLLPTEETTLRTTRPEKRHGRIRAAIATWAKGPSPPRPYKIEPFLPKFQTAPIRFLDKRLPRRRSKIWLLLLFVFFWILIFASILYKSAASEDIPGYGPPIKLSCVSRLW